MKRILFLLPYFNLAGTETHVIELIKALKDEYEILVTAPRGKGIPILERNNIPYREIPYLGFFNVREYKKRLREVINELKPSLIHIHGAHELIFIAKKTFPDIPVIFTCHGYPSTFSSLNYSLSAFFSRWADKVICVSNYDKEILIRKGLSRDKIVVVHNGISESTEEKNLPVKVDGFIIGTIARLTKTKGIEYLINAFYDIAKKYNHVRLVIIGDGEERKSLENLVKKLNIKDKVYFLGNIPGARDYIKNFQIFVLPSLFEPFGLVILEAFSAKVPVIATKVGGIPEIIRDGVDGILVPPKDINALSTAIVTLIEKEGLRYELAQNGYEKFINEFTSTKMAKRTRAVYEEILSSSSK
jgi:glycosyltransferase involved in cell wall biosynthesis